VLLHQNLARLQGWAIFFVFKIEFQYPLWVKSRPVRRPMSALSPKATSNATHTQIDQQADDLKRNRGPRDDRADLRPRAPVSCAFRGTAAAAVITAPSQTSLSRNAREGFPASRPAAPV